MNNYFNSNKFNLQFRLHLFLQLYDSNKLFINENYNKICLLYYKFKKNLKKYELTGDNFNTQLSTLKNIIELIFENNYENKILHINSEKNNEKLTCVLCLDEFKKTCCYNTKPKKVVICNNSFINNECRTDYNENKLPINKQVCYKATDNHHHVMHLDCFNNLFEDTLKNCKTKKNNNFKKVKSRQCLCCTNSINKSYYHRVIID